MRRKSGATRRAASMEELMMQINAEIDLVVKKIEDNKNVIEAGTKSW